jgi:hypothetical protein
MKQPAVTLADLRRALVEQDAQLAAAFARLDPDVPLAVPTASLRLLVEACSRARARPAPPGPITWGGVRC